MLIDEVRKGDVIREPGTKKDIEVKKVTVNACSARGVHINDRFCYELGAQVEVTRSSKAVEEIEDWSDMPDHDIPISEEIKRYAGVLV